MGNECYIVQKTIIELTTLAKLLVLQCWVTRLRLILVSSKFCKQKKKRENNAKINVKKSIHNVQPCNSKKKKESLQKKYTLPKCILFSCNKQL